MSNVPLKHTNTHEFEKWLKKYHICYVCVSLTLISQADRWTESRRFYYNVDSLVYAKFDMKLGVCESWHDVLMLSVEMLPTKYVCGSEKNKPEII